MFIAVLLSFILSILCKLARILPHCSAAENGLLPAHSPAKFCENCGTTRSVGKSRGRKKADSAEDAESGEEKKKKENWRYLYTRDLLCNSDQQ